MTKRKQEYLIERNYRYIVDPSDPMKERLMPGDEVTSFCIWTDCDAETVMSVEGVSSVMVCASGELLVRFDPRYDVDDLERELEKVIAPVDLDDCWDEALNGDGED